MMTRMQKSFLMGAVGDCLGAPIEGIRSLEDIRALYGVRGLTELIESMSPWGDVEGVIPKGQVTDDTTMAMTTAAALGLALEKASPDHPDFVSHMQHFLWQGYLQWGSRQAGGEDLLAKCDPAIIWPEEVKPFWFVCGAGRGTIAILHEDGPGSVAQPLAYLRQVRGEMVRGPNAGCGGMMRVVPLAFLPNISPERLFVVACESAAVTHGGHVAYAATGAVALLVHFAAQGKKDFLHETSNVLQDFVDDPLYGAGVQKVLTRMDVAQAAFARAPYSQEAMDGLPAEIGVKNPFLAGPVLTQVIYALLCADKGVRDALILAANHSGDSDSVAAIVGNVLGAAGMDIPKGWLDALRQKKEIMAAANAFAKCIVKIPECDKKPVWQNPHLRL